jgi:hypothetical protein
LCIECRSILNGPIVCLKDSNTCVDSDRKHDTERNKKWFAESDREHDTDSDTKSFTITESNNQSKSNTKLLTKSNHQPDIN